ncbi:MAG: cytoplasmic protein [Candidatus Bathyarchaeota archaeon B26-1]|nr:MAG: cytoplasmic protein [Candidatus Bathyarchaeota archaeon B26-1]
MSVEAALSELRSYSEELGLDLTKPEDRFKWFLASILFAKRISAEIAKRTYRRFEEEGLTTPERILEAGWDRLVQVLDSGGYVRYDFSTASNLLKIMEDLIEKYGDLEGLHEESSDPEDLEKRLREFKGFGPVGVNIFLRELRGRWEKAKPKPSRMAVETAQRIGLRKIEPHESALVRLNLEYCKKRRCGECPVQEHCKERSRGRLGLRS